MIMNWEWDQSAGLRVSLPPRTDAVQTQNMWRMGLTRVWLSQANIKGKENWGSGYNHWSRNLRLVRRNWERMRKRQDQWVVRAGGGQQRSCWKTWITDWAYESCDAGPTTVQPRQWAAEVGGRPQPRRRGGQGMERPDGQSIIYVEIRRNLEAIIGLKQGGAVAGRI